MRILSLISVLFILLFSCEKSFSQAIDFTQDDCDGQTHNLFQELDSGHIVVMEFVMDCQLCVDGAVALDALFSEFENQYPGVIRVYQFAYATLMDCNAMKAFRDSNNFQHKLFEENGHLMAHYGGFGMPTIGVAAGQNHDDIFSSVGFISSDTAQLGAVLRNYLATISVGEINSFPVSVFPNPAADFLNLHSENEIKFIEFYSMNGELVSTANPATKRVNLAGLSSGIYFIKISDESDRVIRKLFVKQ